MQVCTECMYDMFDIISVHGVQVRIRNCVLHEFSKLITNDTVGYIPIKSMLVITNVIV